MTLASLAVQLLNGLASASSLFLISAGLTLIFGVTRIVNFAHGSLFMLGAYIAFSAGTRFGAYAGSALGFWSATLIAAAFVALLGALIEALLLKRLYCAPELLQLTATFGVVLIVRDAVLASWGPEDRLGPRVAGLDGVVNVLGRAVPEYDLFLLVVGPVVLILLTLLVSRTRFGMLVRAASENRVLAAALGIDEKTLFTVVFALGSFLAGLAGALTLPREPANLGMDLGVIADAFVVTVLGGLGSIPGAFIAAIVIGITKALCIAVGTVQVGPFPIAFPRLTLVIEFVVMALVLLVRPTGLLGSATVVAPTTHIAVERALVRRPGRHGGIVAAILAVLALLLPLAGDPYLLVLATDILVAALFTASLQLIIATGGMISFGHAAYFGIGAYAAALATTHAWPFPLALVLAPVAAVIASLAFGALAVRVSGIYLAMLTLAFAQILWSIAVQWDTMTGGSNGVTGAWPPDWLGERTHYYLFVLIVVAIALVALAIIAFTPLGYALRGARDSALRAASSGIDVRARRIKGLAIAAAFAGISGALFAYSKGGVAPDALSIPRSVDALVMMLLGGQSALFGPLLGATAFTWLSDVLARVTEYWRAWVGIAILVIVSAFPNGIGGTFRLAGFRSRSVR